MTESGWWVLRSPAGRLTVLWFYGKHRLAVAGPYAEWAEAKAEMGRRKAEDTHD